MADVYAFLELEGIEGEAQDSDYSNKIALQSCSWGASNNSSYTTGTGSGIGKGQIHDISVSKFMCKASLKLMERAVNGKPIPSGKLSLLKMAGETKIPYFELELKNIVITSFQMAAGSDGQLPMESFTLHFVEVQSHYKPQGNEGDPAGNVDFGWNLQQNAAA
jgi:type VI secretion system secreted protein Hcp